MPLYTTVLLLNEAMYSLFELTPKTFLALSPIRLRSLNNSASNPLPSVAPSTSHCSINGAVLRASGPKTELSTGTIRHPFELRPSASASCSQNCFV